MPSWIFGTNTFRSIRLKRPWFGHFLEEFGRPFFSTNMCAINSPERENDAPDHEACSNAFVLLCPWSTADQASIIWIAFCAYNSLSVWKLYYNFKNLAGYFRFKKNSFFVFSNFQYLKLFSISISSVNQFSKPEL